MKWYHYLACFFSGVFFMNSTPHFIHGIDGDNFPTPFSGSGLSSPLVNILWALTNVVIGYLLYRGGKVSLRNTRTAIPFFLGVAFVSIMFSIMAATVLQNYKAQ